MSEIPAADSSSYVTAGRLESRPSAMKRPTSTTDLRFLNQHEPVRRHENRLPHWQQDGATYFVTFRLVDSIPQERLDQWSAERQAWLKWNPLPWSPRQEVEYHRRFTARIEAWLDEGAGSCVLREPAVRQIVCQALQHFDGARHWQHAWVVMPNHVHALFSALEGRELESVLQSWKGSSSREVNRLLNQRGAFWMKDYFDRMIRDSQHFWRCARYIRRNPDKAKLRSHEFALFEAPFVNEKLDTERSGGFPAAESPSHSTGRLESRPSGARRIGSSSADSDSPETGRLESRPSGP